MHRPTQVTWVRLVLLLAKRLEHYAPLDYDGGMIIIVKLPGFAMYRFHVRF